MKSNVIPFPVKRNRVPVVHTDVMDLMLDLTEFEMQKLSDYIVAQNCDYDKRIVLSILATMMLGGKR